MSTTQCTTKKGERWRKCTYPLFQGSVGFVQCMFLPYERLPYRDEYKYENSKFFFWANKHIIDTKSNTSLSKSPTTAV